ncbi:hypothetical protein [Fodinicola feengrottensis]|nr:hypothetical protein [Fodinicola feengrottensis]
MSNVNSGTATTSRASRLPPNGSATVRISQPPSGVNPSTIGTASPRAVLT